MAFTYCTNCGEKIDMSEGKCPHCGQTIGNDREYDRSEYTRQSSAPYESKSEDESAQRGQYFPPDEAHGGGDRIPPMWQTFFGAPVPPKKRPISIGLLILSIVNIVFSCCTMTTLIFGVIGLVYTVGAQNAKSESEEVSKKKIALIINIAGLVIGVLSAVSFSIVFADVLAEMLKNGSVQ